MQTTKLYDGSIVNKWSPQCNVCGELDELVCHLGLAKYSCNKTVFLAKEISKLQKSVSIIITEVSCLAGHPYTPINNDFLNILEDKIESILLKMKLPTGFIVPGTTETSGRLDLARAVCRRCERSILKLYDDKLVGNKLITSYMNRLSWYIYLLARYSEEGKYENYY